jgi:hypothetical protein
MKQALLKRMGLRQAELTWAGRETLDLYARTRAKLEALDRWFLDHPAVDGEGRPAAALALYATFSNTASRQLAELRRVLEAMAREDTRYDEALQRLVAEGKKTRAGRAADLIEMDELGRFDAAVAADTEELAR